MKTKRVRQKKQHPGERVKNFDEVVIGYTEKDAVEEARRCLQCRDAGCRKGCPVEIDIPGFIKFIKEREFGLALETIKKSNYLPAVCGRVCPQEVQCEGRCILKKKQEPISIGGLERFVADYMLKRMPGQNPPIVPQVSRTGKKAAVIGSGPAGLTVAASLSELGHSVTVFEALHEPGGVLVYGIPEFRLPKKIIKKEVEYIKSLGVDIKVDVVIGKTLFIKDLFDMGFDAVFIATGAGLPKFLGIPGENLNQIYSGNEFLFRINFMKAYMFPEYDTPVNVGERVFVIGGGNVAVDCARCARRMGARVTVLYRRGRDEMPARSEEIRHAVEEGIEFRYLVSPVGFVDDGNGNVEAVKCIKMQLNDPDRTGRRRPVPVEGSEFVIEADTVIIAIGQSPNLLVSVATPDLEVSGDGVIKVDGDGRTSMKGVFAAGDITTGTATVIKAMGAGKIAARAMHEYIERKGNGRKEIAGRNRT